MAGRRKVKRSRRTAKKVRRSRSSKTNKKELTKAQKKFLAYLKRLQKLGKRTVKVKRGKNVITIRMSLNTKAWDRDAGREALKPGWRKSRKSGRWYYENRANRSDARPRIKL